MRHALAALAFLFAPLPLFAASAGDLVKLADDGNLATTADAAVYYVGEDAKRYVFPGAAAFFTWYENFAGAKILSPAEMAALPLGGNVTYRPGVRMVKIATDPKAYAVDRGGLLRHVVSEAVAACLYGADWNRKIDDVPDAFFADYRLGAPISSCADFSPASAAAASPTISADKGLVADGGEPFPSVPTFSLVPVAASVPAGGQGTLMELRLRTPVAVTVTRLPVVLDALLGAAPEGTADVDLGGLVRGASARANLVNLRWIDASGAAVFGAIPLSLDTRDDQAQAFEFGGAWNVPAGADARLRLVASFDQDLPSGEGFRASVPVARVRVHDVLSAVAAFRPSLDLVAAPVSVGKDAFAVTAAPLPGEDVQVRGAKDAAVGAFVFRASAASDTVVRSIVFQGYLDERESAAGFLPGGDADNGSETRVRDLLPSVRLEDAAGNLVAGPVAVPHDGRASFAGMNLVLPAGSARTFVLRGDLSRDAVIEDHDDRLAFDVVDVARDAVAVTPAGAPIEGEGFAPNGGTSPLYALAVRKHGSLSFAWSGETGTAVVGRETPVGTLTLKAIDDAFDVSMLTFVSADGRSAALTGLTISYAAPDGSARSASASFSGNDAAFQGLAARVPRGGTLALSVSARLATGAGTAVSGDRVRVRFASDRAVAFASAAEGRVFGDADLRAGGSFTVPTNVPSDLLVRLTSLAASRDTATPAGVVARGQAVEVLRFALTAGPEGPARVRKLAFRIRPGDAGAEGPDNDALERWADVNGDFFDDNELIELRRFAGGGYDVLGEGAEASIRYGILRNGALDATPQGLDSAYGDEGVIEVEFNEGAELTIAAGTSATFALALKTDEFRVGPQTLEVRVLGAGDFRWTDRPTGSYDALGGFEVRGLPVVSPPLSVP